MRLRKMGFSVCFLSNNDKQRVSEFCKPMDAVYIFKAGKQSGGFGKGTGSRPGGSMSAGQSPQKAAPTKKKTIRNVHKKKGK